MELSNSDVAHQIKIAQLRKASNTILTELEIINKTLDPFSLSLDLQQRV